MIPLEMPSLSRPRSWFLRSGAAVAFAVVALAVPRLARAHEQFPGIVDDTLGLTCVPPCTLCHSSPQGGGSADQPFGKNVVAGAKIVMADANAVATVDNLAAILKLIETGPCPNDKDKSCGPMGCGPCDADGTGDTDIKEIQANQNPNNSAALPCVEYGCGAHVAPERGSRPLDGTAALFALGAALVLARRFRR